MKATQLDQDITCPVCSGNGAEPTERQIWGSCPRCDGDGVINRYKDRVTVTHTPDDTDTTEEHEEMVLSERLVDRGTHARLERTRLPEDHPKRASFNSLFGSSVPSQMTIAHPNRADALEQRLQDTADPTPDEIITWAQSNGRQRLAKLTQQLKSELNL